MGFKEFALSQLPSPPARVLEVGCGPEGGITGALAEAGYDATGIDPCAPVGERFRIVTLEDFPEQQFDAIVAERVFHHVHELGPAFDKAARLAPLVILEEFAWDRLDEATRDWYEAQHRALRAAGVEPEGPSDLAAWRSAHDDLVPSDVLLREVRARFDERLYTDQPYLYRWLNRPATEPLERSLVDAGAIQPIGFRFVGARSRR